MPYIGSDPSNRFVAPKAASVFSGDGSTTAFTLDHAVGSDEDILVSVDGVIQEPSVAYAVSNGTTLTFTGAPSSNSGNNIFVYYLFRTVGTVSHPSNNALSATSGTFSGAVSASSVDADGGVTVDNITIDGTEIDLSSGDLTLDVAGNIILDADGGVVRVFDGGTQIGNFANNSSDFHINVSTQDKDFAINGNDGGSTITALTLDMSEAGAATFNSSISVANTVAIASSNTSAFMQASDNVFQFGTSSADPVVFLADNSERMRIDTSGRVAMGTTDSTFTNLARLVSASNLASFHTAVFQNTTNNTGGLFLRMMNHAGQDCGSISQSGTTSVNYASSSDYRLKENIKYDFNGISKLKQLKPCEFNFIADDTDSTQAGFIAHEVQDVVPLAVTGKKDEMETYTDDDGKEQKRPRYQGVDINKIVPLLTKALQEAIAEIDTLKTKVAALESK